MAEIKNIQEYKKRRTTDGKLGRLSYSCFMMLLLSIISYSAMIRRAGDFAMDIWKFFQTMNPFCESRTHTEVLGLFGAVVSNWFIISTIGFAVIIVRSLGSYWSL